LSIEANESLGEIMTKTKSLFTPIFIITFFLMLMTPVMAEETKPDPKTAATDATPKPDGEPKADGAYCQDKKPDPPIPDKTFKDTNEILFPGSGGLSGCEKFSMGHMKNLYKGGRRSGVVTDWGDLIAYSCKDSCDTQKKYKDCVDREVAKAKKCESIAYILSVNDRDWNNSEHTEPEKGTTPSATSGIKCKSAGVETLDFEACKKFSTGLDTMEAVQAVGYSAQGLIYQNKMIDAQGKYINEENAATGALKGQKDSIEMQQEMYQQRTAVDAAKLAALYSSYQAMPSMDDIVGQCGAMQTVNITASATLTPEECKTIIKSSSNQFALLQNQSQKDIMKTKMVAVATQAGSSAMLASLLGKRANDIDKAIAKINDFQPIDPLAFQGDDLISTQCQQNPGLPACLTAGLDRTYDALSENVITFGDGGVGTNYGKPTSSDGLVANSIADSATNRNGVDSVGSVITDADNSNSMEKSAAASVTSGATGSNAGGGGVGGGGAGGGGGAPPLGQGTPGGTVAAVTASKVKYEGGANGGLAMMGGFGIKGKKAAEGEENPFGKLFGKDGAKGSGVVNFRDPASQKVGDKGDNLFDMISKRYTSVNADKRLLEYELTK
jgi:hypothetical protein